MTQPLPRLELEHHCTKGKNPFYNYVNTVLSPRTVHALSVDGGPFHWPGYPYPIIHFNQHESISTCLNLKQHTELHFVEYAHTWNVRERSERRQLCTRMNTTTHNAYLHLFRYLYFPLNIFILQYTTGVQ